MIGQFKQCEPTMSNPDADDGDDDSYEYDDDEILEPEEGAADDMDGVIELFHCAVKFEYYHNREENEKQFGPVFGPGYMDHLKQSQEFFLGASKDHPNIIKQLDNAIVEIWDTYYFVSGKRFISSLQQCIISPRR